MLVNTMPAQYDNIFMTFSARTSANQTQDIIDAKMDKRRKGVFGPPAGKRFIIFVDDLNMPQREKYFAQPPLEVLRQWMDHGGWFERKPPCAFKNIVDSQVWQPSCSVLCVSVCLLLMHENLVHCGTRCLTVVPVDSSHTDSHCCIVLGSQVKPRFRDVVNGSCLNGLRCLCGI